MLDSYADEQMYDMDNGLSLLPAHEEEQRRAEASWLLPSSPRTDYHALKSAFSFSPFHFPQPTYQPSPWASSQLDAPVPPFSLASTDDEPPQFDVPADNASEQSMQEDGAPSPTASTVTSLPPSRTRVRPLSASSRQRHRWLDADRRRREAALIERLDTFLSATTTNPSLPRPALPPADAPLRTDSQSSAIALSRDRLSVLRGTVDRLHQLSSLVVQLSATFEANARLLRSLSSHSANPSLSSHQPAASLQAVSIGPSPSVDVQQVLSSLEPAVSSEQALFRRGFQNASVGLLVVDTTSGCCVDANEYWLQQTGWARLEVLHKLLFVPYEVLMRHRLEDGPFTSPCARSNHQRLRYTDNRPLVKQSTAAAASSLTPSSRTASGRTAGVLAEAAEQYPKSVRLLQQLYSGERDSVALLWRFCMADGVVREQRQLAWVSRRRRLVNDNGETEWRPLYLVLAAAFGEPVTLDHSQASKEFE